jgi:hypothetical protein
VPNPNLKQLVKKWAQLLGLQSWDISAAYYETLEMDDPGDFGSVEYNLLRRSARIKILKPSAARGECLLKGMNVEEVLVHELIHLVIAPAVRNPDDVRALEHAVDDLTNALLQKERGA